MTSLNFERMIQLATESFAAQNDPGQLNVTNEIIQKLQKLHPSTVSDYIDGDGPVVWILLIPTSILLMEKFISGNISENELLEKTIAGDNYETIYLCSALVLPEYRRKGLAKNISVNAIKNIRTQYSIKALFTWNFSKEGTLLAERLAHDESLPLFQRKRNLNKL